MIYPHEFRVSFCFPEQVRESLSRIKATNSCEGLCTKSDVFVMKQLANFLIILSSVTQKLPSQLTNDVEVTYLQFSNNDKPLSLRFFSSYSFTEEYRMLIEEALEDIFCAILKQPLLGLQISYQILNDTMTEISEESDF